MNGDGGVEVLAPCAPALVEASALAVMSRSEIDVQIATAHKFRRSLHEFRSLAETMATLDQETAESCRWVRRYKNADGTVEEKEGPSVRFAEICAAGYGNIRYGARIVSIDEKSVTAQGFAHDLERNVATTIEVSRPILTKTGRRYSEHMIQLTAGVVCAIAGRDALLKVIPRTLTMPVYLAARKAAFGDRKTLADRRAQALAHFKKIGVTEERILNRLEKHGIEDIDLEDLALLTGLKTALKEGEISLADAFPVEEPAAEEAGDRSTQLATRIRRGRQRPEEASVPPETRIPPENPSGDEPRAA